MRALPTLLLPLLFACDPPTDDADDTDDIDLSADAILGAWRAVRAGR